ncbi:MAG TPA: hypothetical protein PKH07_06040 [bacterium]|nr:hypothetical protein [bacterium]
MNPRRIILSEIFHLQISTLTFFRLNSRIQVLMLKSSFTTILQVDVEWISQQLLIDDFLLAKFQRFTRWAHLNDFFLVVLIAIFLA